LKGNILFFFWKKKRAGRTKNVQEKGKNAQEKGKNAQEKRKKA